MTSENGNKLNVEAQRNAYTYMRSNNAEVLKAWRDAVEARDEFLRVACDWAVKITGAPSIAVRGNLLEGLYAVGFAADRVDRDALPGHWKKPKHGVITPYMSNTLYKEFVSLRTPAVTIPGRPSCFYGNSLIGSGAMFEWDGYLYSYTSIRDDMADNRWEEDMAIMSRYDWEELRGSTYYAAQEAHADNMETI